MIKHAFLFAVASFGTVSGAQAHEFGQHPALRATASETRIEASALRTGHPAGGRAGSASNNGEHPAVIASRLAKTAGLDPNTYLVQPPASTRWTVAPASPAAVAQIGPR